jgi:hypothetical protein
LYAGVLAASWGVLPVIATSLSELKPLIFCRIVLVSSHPSHPYVIIARNASYMSILSVDGSWNIYSITHLLSSSGRPLTPTHWQISVASSTDHGRSWDIPALNNNNHSALNLGAGRVISPYSNPCPVSSAHPVHMMMYMMMHMMMHMMMCSLLSLSFSRLA